MQRTADQAPPVRRAPEGPEGRTAMPVGGGGAWPDNESTYHHTKHLRRRRYGGHRRDRKAGLRCPRAAARHGRGRTTSRRAERSSQRGRRAGRRPREHQAARLHTSTPSSPAHRKERATPEHQRRHQHRPEHQRRNTLPRHSKAAQPRRGRAAQPVSEDHRRITTMSGSPRPLSWRTFEIPSFEAMSLAVPSMRGSS